MSASRRRRGHPIGWTIAATPFAPDALADLALWLDAADADTITLNGSDVSAWADKGNGAEVNTVNQTVSTRQPGYVTGVQGGLPGVFFSTAADDAWLNEATGGATTELDNVWAGGALLVMVMRGTSTAAANSLIGKSIDIANGWRMFSETNEVGGFNKLTMQWNRSSSASVHRLTDNVLPTGTACILEIEYNTNVTTTPVVRVDGVAVAVTVGGVGGGTFTDALQTFQLGGMVNAEWDNYIHEVMIYKTIPSVSDKAALRAHLTDKWSI